MDSEEKQKTIMSTFFISAIETNSLNISYFTTTVTTALHALSG